MPRAGGIHHAHLDERQVLGGGRLHRRRRRVKPTIDSRRGYFKSHLVNYFIQFVFTLPDVIVGRYSFCLLDQPQILSLILVVVQLVVF